MSRKQLTDYKREKFSFDINKESAEILEKVQSALSIKKGPAINLIIQLLPQLSKEMKKSTKEAYLDKYMENARRMAENGEETENLRKEQSFALAVIKMMELEY